ncbi:MAG: hypothetical protein WCA28_17380 [Bradyrhizobium sp.]
MKRTLAIRRLLAILMIAGLALAPVSRPVMAATSSQGPMPAIADEMMSPPMTSPEMTSPEMTSAEMSADMMAEVADDMPCCPSKAPAPVDCDKCVFMAACGSVCFAGITAGISHPFPVVSDTLALQRNDDRPDGFGHPPPEHPPRRLV